MVMSMRLFNRLITRLREACEVVKRIDVPDVQVSVGMWFHLTKSFGEAEKSFLGHS
jgi:hypothetical protein